MDNSSNRHANSKNRDGLANVIAGSSSICTVGQSASGLTYRGYKIDDLSKHATFEEVAYLLLHQDLPNAQQYTDYTQHLIHSRAVPQSLINVLEALPPSCHPMDVLRTAVSFLGCLEPEQDFSQQLEVANRLLAILPGILLYWYQYHTHNRRINTVTGEPDLASHFLYLLNQHKGDDLAKHALNISLILYAEHEFNASTFAARVCASTLSDFYSCVTAAIGCLKGSLHGGANEAALSLIKDLSFSDNIEAQLSRMLKKKQKIMGFGHRVYKRCDPRSEIIQQCARQLAHSEEQKALLSCAEKIEQFMWNEKKLFPNLDFYSACVYHFLNIPKYLFTPIFVCSRVIGWAAHIIEQRQNNVLIRPGSKYTGPGEKSFTPIEHR